MGERSLSDDPPHLSGIALRWSFSRRVVSVIGTPLFATNRSGPGRAAFEVKVDGNLNRVGTLPCNSGGSQFAGGFWRSRVGPALYKIRQEVRIDPAFMDFLSFQCWPQCPSRVMRSFHAPPQGNLVEHINQFPTMAIVSLLHVMEPDDEVHALDGSHGQTKTAPGTTVSEFQVCI